jgi:hypothetical protein
MAELHQANTLEEIKTIIDATDLILLSGFHNITRSVMGTYSTQKR